METLFAIAAEQHGLFTRAQAHRCGVSDRVLRYRVHSGMLERLPRGVFRVNGSVRSWQQRVLQAVWSGGPSCVASHRTAAQLHRLDVVRTDLIEVTVPRAIRYKSRDVIVHQSLDLVAGDCTIVDGIPLTTPARTLIDLGAVTHWHRVEEAFDGAERDFLTTTDAVARRHNHVRRQGRNGVGPMAVVLDKRVAVPPKSVLERQFVRLCEDASLPLPICQYEVCLPSGRSAYIDAVHEAQRLAWELDSHQHHSTRRQRAADNARAAELADLGWSLRRFTYEQVMYNGPAVVGAVRRALFAASGDK